MNANCAICSELLDETSEIVAAPCGHVYHASCLTTWVNQSKSCPQCRSRICIKGFLKLYFNYLPQSETNASDLENEIINLTSRLNAKETELRTCKQERDDHIAYVCDAEESASDLLEEISKLQYEVSRLNAKAQSLSVLNAKVFELEQINAALSNDLEHFRGIQAIVGGTRRDVEDILREHINHSKSAEQLAIYCACLKRELLEVVEHRNQLMQSNSKLKSDNNAYVAKMKFYEDALGVPKSEFQEKMAAPTKTTLISDGNPFPATSCTRRDYVEEICLSPLSVTINRNKFNLCFETPNSVCTSSSTSQSNFQFSNQASGAMKKKNDSSVIRIQYNDLESRGKMTASSGFRKIKITKQT